MSSAFKRLSNSAIQPVQSCPVIQNDRVEVIKKLNEKLECFNFENSQSLKKLHGSIEELNGVLNSHSDRLNQHQDSNDDLKEQVNELTKLVNEHVEELKGFKDEIYNVVEEYIVSQTPRFVQQGSDESQKKILELTLRVDELNKKLEDLTPKIHIKQDSQAKIEKLRLERVKS